MSRLSSFLRERRLAVMETKLLFGARFGRDPGIERGRGKIPVTVTLTTVPGRLERVPIVIESLLRQIVKPDRLVLWLDEKLESKVPELLRRQMERGLELRFVADIGPYTKVIYALEEFAGDLIVTCDDDVIYPAHWLAGLIKTHEREPRSVICHRARQMTAGAGGVLHPYMQWKVFSGNDAAPSFSLFPICMMGILYPPGALHPEVFNQSVFRKICPIADDVWMKMMSLMNRVPCLNVTPPLLKLPVIRGTQGAGLHIENMIRGRNDAQLRAVIEHYGLQPRLASADFTLFSRGDVV